MCSQTKAESVSEDNTGPGRRSLLNLGHTFAHAFEACAGMKGDLLHGEAVSVGLVMAFEMSERLGVCESGTAARIARHLSSVSLPVKPADLPLQKTTADDVFYAMTQDKKMKDGRLRFILARGIGRAFMAEDVDPSFVKEFLAEHLPTGGKRGGARGGRSKPKATA